MNYKLHGILIFHLKASSSPIKFVLKLKSWISHDLLLLYHQSSIIYNRLFHIYIVKDYNSLPDEDILYYWNYFIEIWKRVSF